MLQQHKVEKLPLIDDNGVLQGLVTIKDIEKRERFPNANKDKHGRLRVGAAIGVGQLDRARALVAAGVDVIVLDSAHGHSQGIIDTLKMIKAELDVDVIAGNIRITSYNVCYTKLLRMPSSASTSSRPSSIQRSNML